MRRRLWSTQASRRGPDSSGGRSTTMRPSAPVEAALAQPGRDLEADGRGHPLADGLEGGALDGGAVGQGIGEGYAQLDEGSATLDQGGDEAERGVDVGIAGREI